MDETPRRLTATAALAFGHALGFAAFAVWCLVRAVQTATAPVAAEADYLADVARADAVVTTVRWGLLVFAAALLAVFAVLSALTAMRGRGTWQLVTTGGVYAVAGIGRVVVELGETGAARDWRPYAIAAPGVALAALAALKARKGRAAAVEAPAP